MNRKLMGLIMGTVFAVLTASAGDIFNTLPRNDQAAFTANCGQTWMTGSLGTINKLGTIEVATRSDKASGGNVYLAVYENNAASGSAATWSIGNLVAVSANPQNMSVTGVVNTFNFNYEVLSDHTRYLYTFVNAATNGVGVGAGVTLRSGGPEQSAYTAGGIAFFGSHTIASRITTVDLSAPTILSFTASKTSVFPGETVALSWNTTNAISVVLEPGFGSMATAGTTQVVIATNITYSLIAAGASTSVTNHLEITLNPTAELYAQYRADAGVTTTNAPGEIASWANQAAGSRNLDRIFGTPRLAAHPVDGGGTADVVELDGRSALWATAGDWGSLSGDRTIVAHVRLTGTGDGFLFDGSTGGGKTRAQVRDTMWQAGVQSDAFSSADTDTAPITKQTWQTHIFQFDENGGKTEVTHWIDGIEAGHHTNAVDTALGGLIVGANGTPSMNLSCRLAELLAYNGLLTPAERTDLQADINSRWGHLTETPFTYQSNTVVQTPDVISNIGIHGIVALELSSIGTTDTLLGDSVTSLSYNLNGTTNPVDIEEVRLYEGGSVFRTGTTTLLGSQAGPSGTFSLNHPISSEKQTLWIAVKLRGTSVDGDLVDAEITEFTLSGPSAGTYVPAITAPAGLLTIQANAFFSTVLRSEGDDGSAFFRIPGLVTTTNDTLIAAFDVRWGGGYDLPGNMDVAIMRSTDGGFTWGPMQIIMDYDKDVVDSQDNGVGDPCILVDRVNGRIWCAAIWSFGNRGWNGSGPGLTPAETGQFVLNYSDDDGVTWTDPVSITSEVKDPAWRLYFQGPGKGICTRNGTLIFPAQFREANGVARSNFIYSTDRGASWNNAPAAQPTGLESTNEAQILELDNGDLLLSMKNFNKRNERLWCIYSWDHETETIADGSWGTPWYEQTDPHVMASVECYRSVLDGHPWSGLLFSNPDSTSREKMTIRLSLDEGRTWPYKRKIDDLLAAYSCMTILPDGDIGILYETGETSSISRLVFARFSLEWLVGTADTDGDGITDFDEDWMGLNKNNPDDADEDSDGDGMSNRDEARAQTLPFDATSVLCTFIETQRGNLQIEWPTVPYLTYRLESCTNLVEGNWAAVPGMEAIMATSTELSVQIPVNEDPTSCYRIVLP